MEFISSAESLPELERSASFSAQSCQSATHRIGSERRFCRSDATPIDGEIIFVPSRTENRQQIRIDLIWHGFWLTQSFHRGQEPEL
jgi:hypothetical protein